uniref:Uncharacterized protein n=1 Tax=Methanococcus maripaludis (strain C6 / ATCC BAA-1332) TaxID=444158 RepID=A9A7G7_METM6
MNINPNEFQMQYLVIFGLVSVLLLLAKEFTAFFLVIVGFAAAAVVFHRTTFHGVSFLNYRLSKDGVTMVHYNSIKSIKGFGAGNNSQKSPSTSGGPTLNIGKTACSGASSQGTTDKTPVSTGPSKSAANLFTTLSDSTDDTDDTKGD